MTDTLPHSDRAVRQVWSAGRYPSLAPNLLPAVARLVTASGVTAEDRVLDVGCGTGNVSIAARRAGSVVTGLDLTRPMLEGARENTAVADLTDITWIEGDAESLPFRNDSYDVVLSNFGHVFAPSPRRATKDMLRVTQPGGTVAFTAWSPEGLVGELTEILARHLGAGVEGSRRHLRWGDSSYVRDQLPGSCSVHFERRAVPFRYVSPEHFWEAFAEESGPLSPVVSRLDDQAVRSAIKQDALECLEEWFVDNAVRVEYLLVRVGVGDSS